MKKTRQLLSYALVLCLCWPLLVMAERVSRHAETASGLQGWLVRDEQIEIQLNPLTLEQVRAFYLGRGFSEIVTEQISQNCTFQFVIKNRTDSLRGPLISINLADWRLHLDGRSQPLKPKADWLKQWASLGASPASLLAFRWATFPEEQDYAPSGDYGWGMNLFGLPPGSIFDLELKWKVAGKEDQQWVKGVMCPSEKRA